MIEKCRIRTESPMRRLTDFTVLGIALDLACAMADACTDDNKTVCKDVKPSNDRNIKCQSERKTSHLLLARMPSRKKFKKIGRRA